MTESNLIQLNLTFLAHFIMLLRRFGLEIHFIIFLFLAFITNNTSRINIHIISQCYNVTPLHYNIIVKLKLKYIIHRILVRNFYFL